MAAVTLLVSSGPLLAQAVQDAYPSKPVRLVVGFPPGGSNDIVARIISVPLGQLLGQPVVVENKAGASGVLASSSVAKAEADGYTLLLSSASPLVIAPHLMPRKPFDVTQDLVSVGTLGWTPETLAVGPGLKARDFKEFIELAKNQEVTVSSSGNGGLPHLTIELLRQAVSDKIMHVPYKGAGPAVSDTLAGHVHAVTMDLPAVINFVREGKLRALAVTSDQRIEFLKDVPTVQEQGVPSFSSVNWFGLFAPKGTSPEIVNRLHAAIGKMMEDPQLKQQLMNVAVVPQSSASPAEFAAFVAKEDARWGKVARSSGVTID